ncbi:MAG TPA: tetratricopeptide repeat protein [Hyphomicrobiaceae bacterium]|nr:tetratricopeptide repeat protein [Hyphomicrobiaceae bacterium]
MVADRERVQSRVVSGLKTLSLALAGALALSGCAQLGDLPGLSSAPAAPQPAATADATSQTELEKALDYWAKAYAKNPKDADAGLSYAKNLKAAGRKSQALAVLQQLAMYHGSNRAVLSEYGRLALESDQITTALKVLEQADDPAHPDWRVISARGTAMAKLGKYKEAIPLFERALTLSGNQPSILNNLALAYTMDGQPDKAEAMLRDAAAAPNADPRIRQNLALVLAVQGKHAEARAVAGQDLAPEHADANMALLRKIVKAEGPAAPAAAPALAGAPAATAVPAAFVTDPAPAAPTAPKAAAKPKPKSAAPSAATAAPAGSPTLRTSMD